MRLSLRPSLSLCAICLVVAAPSGTARADDASFLRGGYAHFGVSASKQADEGTMRVNGVVVPGADFVTSIMGAASVEAGLLFRGGFGISLAAVAPATTSNIASGTLTGLGNLGNETDAYYSLTAHWHAPLSDRVMPYFGGGVGHMQVLSTGDGAVSNFNVKSAFGLVAQAGIDIKLSDRFGVFADMKRYFMTTTATGNLGPALVTADAKVDPWIVTAGASVFF
jgi:outer membrane protein